MSKSMEQLEQLVADMRVSHDKLYNKNTKAQATVLRKQAQQGKALMQQLRLDALEHQKSIPTKAGRGGGFGRKSPETEEDETVDQ